MAEVLLWLYALEEHHKKRLDHVHGKRHYFNVVRPASIGGLVLAGLIYARGLVTHSLIETANLVQVLPPLSRRMVTPGGGGTYIGRGPLYDLYWKPFDELPLPDRPERHGRDKLYEQYVQRKALLAPLEAAADFLRSLPD